MRLEFRWKLLLNQQLPICHLVVVQICFIRYRFSVLFVFFMMTDSSRVPSIYLNTNVVSRNTLKCQLRPIIQCVVSIRFTKNTHSFQMGSKKILSLSPLLPTKLSSFGMKLKLLQTSRDQHGLTIPCENIFPFFST